MSSSSFSASLTRGQLAVLQWMRGEKKREPTKLSLCVCPYDSERREFAVHPGTDHVEALWLMPREQRLKVWEALGRYDEAPLEVLELGDSADFVDDEEMRFVMQVVLPERLDSVRVLSVTRMWKLTDSSFQALADKGCGKNLTSLTLAEGKGSAGLETGVTDASLQALAEKGCGESLTMLAFWTLQEGVTDTSLQALAEKGCGKNLMSLVLHEVGIAALRGGVTDVGLQALVAVGCGRNLTSVFLDGNRSITSNNFAAALGLPKENHGDEPQAVYREWCKCQGVDPDSPEPASPAAGPS